MYLYIENEKIIEAFCGDIPEYLKGKKLTKVPDDADIRYDIPLSWYTSDWTIKDISTLINEGLYTLPKDKKIVENQIVNKTDLEMYLDGTKEIPKGFKIENGELVEMTNNEKLSSGIITQRDMLIIEQSEKQTYLDSTDWYITRKMEREIDIPNEVSKKRIECINRINEIRELLA